MVWEEKFNPNFTKTTLFLSGAGRFLMNKRTALKLQTEETQAMKLVCKGLDGLTQQKSKSPWISTGYEMRAGHSTDSPVLAGVSWTLLLTTENEDGENIGSSWMGRKTQAIIFQPHRQTHGRESKRMKLGSLCELHRLIPSTFINHIISISRYQFNPFILVSKLNIEQAVYSNFRIKTLPQSSKSKLLFHL